MIYVVTNRKLIEEGNIYSISEKACKAGANAIILREKDLCYEKLYEIALKLKSITESYGKLLIVNDNLEIAKEVDAYGYQVSYEKFKKLRKPFGINVGVSVHSLEEAVDSEKLGAKYILLGNIYETDCKKGLKGKGEAFLKEVVQKVSIPVIAIGGINENNIDNIRKTGAYGAAVMSLAMKNPHKIRKLPLKR